MTKVQARTVLWYLVFVGFAVNYMIRINLNITIVEMVASKRVQMEAIRLKTEVDRLSETGNFSTSEPVTNSSFIGSISKKDADKFSIERAIFRSLGIDFDDEGFHWNEYQQGLVLGAFFWLHWVTQVPGGILAKKYGTKIVFGMANVLGCWICFILPAVSYWDYRALVAFRVLQGFICGLAWPAMHNMTAQWIPPNERSKFVSAYLGSSVGIAVFYPLFGFVISWTSWEWVFHICGILGTLWFIAWLFFVFDSPAKHPRISQTELRYIVKALGDSVQPTTLSSTPWKAILTSRPVWMNVIAQWGGVWGLFTLMTQAPTYFKVVHNWDIKTTGILSGLPHLMRMSFALVFSLFVDYLLRTNKMSRTNVRKLATTMCCIVNGSFVLALAFFGYNAIAAVVLLTVATMFHGAVSSGPLASIVDIAPNYAGIVMGLSGMISILPGFISPIIVGLLTLGNQSLDSWKYVFIIAAVMLIGTGILYVFLCESTLQSWNTPENKTDTDKEMQPLKEIKSEKDDIVRGDS